MPGRVSIVGPSSSRRTSRASGTKKTTCGLPTLNAIGCSSSSQASGKRRVHRIGQRNVLPAELRLDERDFDLCRCLRLRAGRRRYRSAWRRLAAPRSASHCRSFRPRRRPVPDPHPKVGAVAGLEQDELVAADACAAVGDRLGQRRRDLKRLSRASTMTKSLPRPCILWKGRPIGRGLRERHAPSPPAREVTNAESRQ